ncbi:MAG TPA: GrpB family protein [Ktedonobacteraceae bacterium]|nr:GrpB family protein [Ktedonobacteraceae bacterium]
MQNLITITPYRPQWPEEFRQLGLKLREALGDLAIRIDHIGSTAVPGLAAKDVIDIQITVTKLDAEKLIPIITGAGYIHGADINRDHMPAGRNDAPEEWSKLIFSTPAGQRRVNLHIRQAGRANQRYAQLFRDYLRADNQVRDAYQQIKEALARLHPSDIDAYYDVKDPVCDIIMATAERWATAINYVPGARDL